MSSGRSRWTKTPETVQRGLEPHGKIHREDTKSTKQPGLPEAKLGRGLFSMLVVRKPLAHRRNFPHFQISQKQPWCRQAANEV
jgi:hypothetical protein